MGNNFDELRHLVDDEVPHCQVPSGRMDMPRTPIDHRAKHGSSVHLLRLFPLLTVLHGDAARPPQMLKVLQEDAKEILWSACQVN